LNQDVLLYQEFKMIDFVLPKNNEKEFIEISKKLDFTSLIFCYPLSSFPKQKIKNQKYAVICSDKEIQKAKKLSNIILLNTNNRSLFDKKNLILFDLEKLNTKDSMHYRNSGINHILAKLCSKNNIKILFSFNSLLNSKKMLTSQLIGRMKQNIKLTRKYKIKTIIASFAQTPFEMRSAQDLISFGISLGMHPSEAKSSLQTEIF
jgi:ribonuclease P/MRP protein subunit RPP1